MVFMTLRRGLNKINYFPIDKNREVDFCVFNQLTGRSSLVQVSWDISDEETFKRELSALRDAREASGIDDCTVVTWDDEMTLEDGIRVVPAWEWCIEQDQPKA